MNIETVVSDVKGRFDLVSSRAQAAAEASFDTLKLANEIVISSVQGLVKTHTDAAKDLYSVGKTSFDKVRNDGLKAVAANPVEYLPDGRERLLAAFNETLTTFTKTGEELGKVFKTGYGNVSARINGDTPVQKAKATARKASGTARKTVRKGAKSVRKTATRVEKATA